MRRIAASGSSPPECHGEPCSTAIAALTWGGGDWGGRIILPMRSADLQLPSPALIQLVHVRPASRKIVRPALPFCLDPQSSCSVLFRSLTYLSAVDHCGCASRLGLSPTRSRPGLVGQPQQIHRDSLSTSVDEAGPPSWHHSERRHLARIGGDGRFSTAYHYRHLPSGVLSSM